MNEKAYKTMSRSGAGALTVGIIMMVAGLVCGIIACLLYTSPSPRDTR